MIQKWFQITLFRRNNKKNVKIYYLPSWPAPLAAPLADFPFVAAGVVESMFAPGFTEFPFPFEAAAGASEADVADLVGLESFEVEFDEIIPFLATFSAAVEFSLLFGEIGKSSSVAG